MVINLGSKSKYKRQLSDLLLSLGIKLEDVRGYYPPKVSRVKSIQEWGDTAYLPESERPLPIEGLPVFLGGICKGGCKRGFTNHDSHASHWKQVHRGQKFIPLDNLQVPMQTMNTAWIRFFPIYLPTSSPPVQLPIAGSSTTEKTLDSILQEAQEQIVGTPDSIYKPDFDGSIVLQPFLLDSGVNDFLKQFSDWKELYQYFHAPIKSSWRKRLLELMPVGWNIPSNRLPLVNMSIRMRLMQTNL